MEQEPIKTEKIDDVIFNKYKGVPRFIAETLSPRTALRDRTIKLKKYANLGVNEY